MAEADAVANAIAAFADLDAKTMLDALVAVLGERPEVLQGLVDWAVPDHAFVPSKVITDHRFEGTVKSFSEKNFFGFIDSPSHKEYFGNDVFVHGAQIGSLAYVGAECNFAVFLNKDHKPQAFDIHPGTVAEYQKKGHTLAPKGAKGAAKGAWDAAPGKAALGPRVTTVAWNGSAGNAWASDAWSGSQAGGAEAWSEAPAKGGGRLGPGQMIGAKGGGKGCQASAKGGGANYDAGAWKGGKAANEKGGKGAKGPPVTTVDMPGVTDKRFKGMLKSYSDKNGFGFIICPEIAEIFQQQLEVFVHRMQIGNFKPGDEVSFGCIINRDGKPQGIDLQPVSGKGAGSPAKRPRIEAQAPAEEAYEEAGDEGWAAPDEAYEEFAEEGAEAW